MMPLIAISDQIVRGLVSMPVAIDLVEQAFAASARGRATAFPVVVEWIHDRHAMFGIKSGYLLGQPAAPDAGAGTPGRDVDDVLGLKAGGYWSGNAAAGLPGHQSVMLLFDLATGAPTALVAANAITSLRTGAAGGVAARHLSREDARVAAVIGAGDQARMQIEALLAVRPIEELRVFSIRREEVGPYLDCWTGRLRAVEAPSVRSAVEGADIVVTTTPSRTALVRAEWIAAGTHINAIGADAPGKHELDERLLPRTTFVADLREQSARIGELQHAIAASMLGTADVHAELGEICAGMRPGRTSRGEITVFDSTGVTFQDLVVAGYVYRLARDRGLGVSVCL
jgi:ornithine cyclodeaminase/alanine dehydrogenase